MADTVEATGKDESVARHTRNIMKDLDDTRSKLNRKLNDVRNYGADARETTL